VVLVPLLSPAWTQHAAHHLEGGSIARVHVNEPLVVVEGISGLLNQLCAYAAIGQPLNERLQRPGPWHLLEHEGHILRLDDA
jgi:hypothetical protein